MKNKKNDPFKNLVLDAYEQDLEDHADEFVSVPNKTAAIKQYREYFKAMPKKDRRITIRVNQADLDQIKQKASQTGIPYQTLVNSLLHQYASGQISLSL